MHGHDTPVVIPDPKGYESSDLILAPIIKWVTNLLLFVGISSLATWFIYLYLLPKQNSVGATNRFSFERRLPPEPRLQAAPKTEMKDFRIDEKEKTENAGWVDRQKGVVRISIEQAMEDAVKNGIESTPKETAPVPINNTQSAPKPIENKPAETVVPKSTDGGAPANSESKPTAPNPTPNEAGKAKPSNP